MRWFVLQIAPGREMEAAASLTRQGAFIKVPRENRIIRSGGKWIEKEYLLFPGYVFMAGEYPLPAEDYYKAKETVGVIKFLGVGKPQPISYLEAEYILLLTPTTSALEPSIVAICEDGSVDVISGILKKLSDRIVSIDKHSRKVKVKLPTLEKEKITEFSVTIMEKEKF
ncbi:MAG: transcription termination/antitermination NusG family protein [Oscillospiraceae bacterium]